MQRSITFFAVLALVAMVYLLGAAGGLETGRISAAGAVVRILISCAVVVVSFVAAVRVSKEEKK